MVGSALPHGRNNPHTRRARLVARLCDGIAATITDAKSLGYCEPGIRQFQARHGIGDVALALSIARKAGRSETLSA
jgi:hypothetical protein